MSPIISELEALRQDALILDAQLNLTIGEGGESFRIFSDEIQEMHLWGCQRAAERMASALSRVIDLAIAMKQGEVMP